MSCFFFFFFFQAEDGIRDWSVTGVQTCALPISFVTCEHSAKDRDRDCPAVASVIKSWQNAAKSRRKSEEGRAAARTTAGFLSDSAFLILEPLLLKSISPSAGSFRFVLPHDRAALIDITPAARLERYPC